MRKTILLVDDEPMIREVVEERLRRIDAVFLHANDGVEALSILADHPQIGAVISDIRMPGMDGIELIRKVREAGNQVPFIFFTAFATRETLNEVVKHGVRGFIEKGQMDGLEEAVIESLRDGQEVSLKDLFQELDWLAGESERKK